MAAHMSAEQLRADVIGIKDVINKRVSYTAYPALGITTSTPMRKHNCPGCTVRPPKQITWLSGNVVDITLKEAMKQIEEKLGSDDFEMMVHQLNFDGTALAKFYFTTPCKYCKKEINIMKHEGRIEEKDLICEECMLKDLNEQTACYGFDGEFVTAFTKENSQALADKTLFELGYPLGAHIMVMQRNGAIDFLDKDKIVTTFFAFDEDRKKIHSITKL